MVPLNFTEFYTTQLLQGFTEERYIQEPLNDRASRVIQSALRSIQSTGDTEIAKKWFEADEYDRDVAQNMISVLQAAIRSAAALRTNVIVELPSFPLKKVVG